MGTVHPVPDFAPAAYVCLVPWLVAVCGSSRRRWPYFISYCFGLAFFGVTVRWMFSVTPPAYVALILYQAVYFPAAAWLIRHMVRRRGVRLTFVVPVVWTAVEFFRGTGHLGFPWVLLGQSQYRFLTAIQVADLGGVYAVSFVVAMVNGLVADLILDRTRPAARRPSRRATVVIAVVLVAATIGYGRFRLGQTTTSDGPMIAVVQGDYLLSVTDAPNENMPFVKRRAYFTEALTAAREQPDMIVLPETPWPMTLNTEYRHAKDPTRAQELARQWAVLCHTWLTHLADPDPDTEIVRSADEVDRRRQQLSGDAADWLACTGNDLKLLPAWQQHLSTGRPCTVVTGGFGHELFPTNVYPKERRYNAAYVYTPPSGDDAVTTQHRYNKIHLVMFGEYIPFREGPLHSVYLWLNSLTPWGATGLEYSLSAGREFTTFEIAPSTEDAAKRTYRFATPICYEDTIPYVCRSFARAAERDDDSKRLDFLVNVSNDGWFGHSVQQPQHLAISVFRAVEHRVGIARAVNTGMSGFIDPTGRLRDVLSVGEQGHRISSVVVDTRTTLYSRWGDWFAITCLAPALLMVVDAIQQRRRDRPAVTQDDA
jgi:apolipoprotein N-acyltransferase